MLSNQWRAASRLIPFCLLILQGCGGGGGSGGGNPGPQPPAQPAPAPTLSLNSNSSAIAQGATITLTWSTTNATGCTASGGWTGARAASGSETLGPLTADTIFTLMCTGAGGSITQSATIAVSTAPPPTVSITSSNSSIASGAAVTLTWTSTNATACQATGNWIGNLRPSGTALVTRITGNATFGISCTGPGGTQTASVAVSLAGPPVVSISVSPDNIAAGETATVTWSATDATDCVASGDWAGQLAAAGSRTIGPLTGDSSLTVTCTGPGGIRAGTASVAVSAAAQPVAVGKLAAHVQVLDAVTRGLISSTTPTSITFDGNVPITTGTVFLVEGTAHRASSVALLNGQTVVGVVAPSFEEVFDRLQISGRYVVDSAQVVAAAEPRRTPFRADKSTNATNLALNYSFSEGGVTASGSATLTLALTPDFHYDKDAGGLTKSSLTAEATVTSNSTHRIDATAEWTVTKKLRDFRVPIPLSIVDSALNLIGVNLASIYIPTYAGLRLDSEFILGFNTTMSAGARVRVFQAENGSPQAEYDFSDITTTITGVTAGPPSGAQALATLTNSAYLFIQARPALAVLNTVALLGVDLRIGPRAEGTLQFLPTETPPYCESGIVEGAAEANGYFKAVGADERTTDTQSFEFLQSERLYLGSCRLKSTTTLALAPNQTPTAYERLFVTATVAPMDPAAAAGRVPSGRVRISLGNVNCEAVLDNTGAGTCALDPPQAGSLQLTGDYLGDENFSTGSSVLGATIAKAATLTVLNVNPNPAVDGETVSFGVVVTPSPDRGYTPLGTVSVLDENNVTVCTATLLASTGAGTCTQVAQGIGQRRFRAVYAGSAAFATSSSADMDHSVTQGIVTFTYQGNAQVSGGTTIVNGQTVDLVPPGPVQVTVTFRRAVAPNYSGSRSPADMESITFNSDGVGSVTFTGAEFANLFLQGSVGNYIVFANGMPSRWSLYLGGLYERGTCAGGTHYIAMETINLPGYYVRDFGGDQCWRTGGETTYGLWGLSMTPGTWTAVIPP